MAESPAVAVARAHLEAWTTHDFESARGNLAEGTPRRVNAARCR
jgi:hypothetical protein